jgi:RNA polymerase sigma factor (sigma-70 family)
MDQIPDIILIRGILEHKSSVIQKVYDECFPMIERMVINSGGDNEQAKDVFQDGLLIVYRKLSNGEFQLSCKFSTYLYAICKKLWAQEKKKRITRMRQIPSEQEMLEEPDSMYNEEEDNIKQIYHYHFKEISKDCQKILILHFNRTPIEEIQKIMNYQNPHYTMDRKYRCKKSLIQRILKDPKYKSAQNEYSGNVRIIH